MKKHLPDVVVTNLHRRYTGVSATVRALVPIQRQQADIGLLDTGDLGLGGELSLWQVIRQGWSRPRSGPYRIWHARRDVEILLGAFLRSVLRQPWRVLFTSAAPRRPGRVLQWTINLSDAIVATSERAAGFLSWHTCVIHHGVDTDWFTPPADRTAALNKVWPDLNANGTQRRAIGVFGRIRPSKGTDLAVSALLQVLPQHPDFVAFFTGLCQPSDRAYLQKLGDQILAAGLSDRIRFVGDVPAEHIPDWVQAASVVVAASRSEGFGLTPLEAMASGCAVVTSEAGVWPWVIDEQVGGLFQTGSADDLAHVLASVIRRWESDPTWSERIRDHALKRHSIWTEATRLGFVYKQMHQGL